jgi:tRNA pseudouridine32 synthase/23S rRNA pseudouridine746 synthase
MARRNLKRDRDQVLSPLQEAIAAADAKMQVLKKQRRELSRTLQTQMHNAYVLTNFAGETRSLRELITEGAMPTGMGDCCAPKLLHYAATHDLTPVAMAEFWWGNPSLDGYKIQGEFYGACVERCQPLMGFLLSGRRSPPAPSTVDNFAKQNCQIIYEDEYLIAIAKPPELLSVPGRYLDTQDSVLSRLRQYFGNDRELYPVHRLDRQTSGILLFARDVESLRNLSEQFQRREIHKIYEAILSGKLELEQGKIDLPLWGNPENRPRQQVDWQRGKPSVTEFRLLGHETHYSRIEFMPLTGRTHQLRVHSADPQGLGIPILGDRLYGCQAATSRLHLHARELTFRHPRSQEFIHLQISVPF